MDAYCENGECRVVLFRAEPVVKDNESELSGHNCPGCGQFGRLKDEPKEK